MLDGGVFFAGSDFGDSLLYARGGDIHFATGGLSADSERLRIADTAATFTVDIKTSRIVGRADNDASIELGTGFVVVVGGVQHIIANDDNLTLDFPQLDLKNTGGEASTELFFGGAAKDVSTFARYGKIQGRLSEEAVAAGQYKGELCFWSQLGSPPYYRTNPDIQIKTNGSVAFNNGDIQTSRIVGSAAPIAMPTLSWGRT